MKKLIVLVLAISLTATSLLVSGCNNADAASASGSPPPGKGCVVQFRRDALGCGRELPIPPTSSSINGADTTVGGKLKLVTDDWIVIEHPELGELWIARSTVLLLSMGVPPAPRTR